jgi:3-deoxy-D-manno-octulosonic-acid transferase
MINILYSYIILPLLVVFSHLAAIFSRKIRKPLWSRYKIFSELEKWKTKAYDQNKKVVVIHSASMGEFEHIKPLIAKIKERFQVNIIVTFFSPSGYENIKTFPGVDLFLYIPLDFSGNWKKFYSKTNTEVLIISKHDVWPNQIKIAKKMKIKTILVNASLNENSSRNSLAARLMLAPAYNSLDRIFAISNQDGKQFESSFRCQNIVISGDTKFDQVFNRKKKSEKNETIHEEWLSGNIILILGSLWPQDAEHVLKDVPSLLENYYNLKIIIVPHQPTTEYINNFGSYFTNFEYSLFSEDFKNRNTRLLIIDKIGLLADIYKHGDIAYVGGSFKQGIHNVMEPAVYGLPVVFGPVHINSYEAKKLLKKGGALTINNSDDFMREISGLIDDKSKRETIGNAGFNYLNQNSGATNQILEFVDSILN